MKKSYLVAAVVGLSVGLFASLIFSGCTTSSGGLESAVSNVVSIVQTVGSNTSSTVSETNTSTTESNGLCEGTGEYVDMLDSCKGGECGYFGAQDIRVLCWADGDWQFCGTYAKAQGLVTVSGTTVIATCKTLDGYFWEVQGYRLHHSSDEMVKRLTGTYEGETYRVYFKCRK